MPRTITGHSERLAARARRGDRAARAAVVEEHMGLVRSVAFHYRDLGLPLEDLVQEGAIGLLAAVDDYDPDRGASFSTYAYWRVRAAITHALTAHGNLVRVPRPLLERRREVAHAHERLLAQGRRTSVAALAEETALTPVDVATALRPIRVASLDDDAPGTAASPQTQLVDGEQAFAVRTAVRRLPRRKRAIVSRHFGLAGEPESLAAIAHDLALSPARTRALKDEALRDLAAALEPVR